MFGYLKPVWLLAFGLGGGALDVAFGKPFDSLSSSTRALSAESPTSGIRGQVPGAEASVRRAWRFVLHIHNLVANHTRPNPQVVIVNKTKYLGVVNEFEKTLANDICAHIIANIK